MSTEKRKAGLVQHIERSREGRGRNFLYRLIIPIAVFLLPQFAACTDAKVEERKFQICREYTPPDSGQCSRIQEVTIRPNRITQLGKDVENGAYYKGNLRFSVRIPPHEMMRRTDADMNDVNINFTTESQQQAFAKWLSTPVTWYVNDCPSNQERLGMHMITQSCLLDGVKTDQPATTYYVPSGVYTSQLQDCISIFTKRPLVHWKTEQERNRLIKDGGCGKPAAWFICAEPQGGLARLLDSEFSCRVHGYLTPDIGIEYSILHRNLPHWDEVHRHVTGQISSILTIKESGGNHGK